MHRYNTIKMTIRGQDKDRRRTKLDVCGRRWPGRMMCACMTASSRDTPHVQYH